MSGWLVPTLLFYAEVHCQLLCLANSQEEIVVLAPCVQVFILLYIVHLITSASWSAQAFRIRPVMPSGPAASLVFALLKALLTSCSKMMNALLSCMLHISLCALSAAVSKLLSGGRCFVICHCSLSLPQAPRATVLKLIIVVSCV